MKDNTFRFGRKLYADDRRYPRGFRRSGDYTIAESDLLSEYGDTMQQLASGQLMPMSAEEHRFVAVCQGEREPVSSLERVWMKYQRLASRRPRWHTLYDHAAGKGRGGDDELFFDD